VRLFTSHRSLISIFYGRGAGVGRTRGTGVGLAVAVAVGVGVSVAVAVAVAVGVGVGEADCAQYLPPVFKLLPESSCPPQTIIWLPVHTAV